MFTNYSNELIDFVKNKKHNLSYNKIFKELYNFLETKYNNIYFKLQELDTKKTKKVDSSFISEKLKNDINNLSNHKSYLLQHNKSKIIINIYYSNENIDEFINIISKIISFIFNISSHKINDCVINYYLTDFIKVIDSSKNYDFEELTNHEINSGSTNMNTNEINIWRKEEIIKVTLHECIHLLDYDSFDYDKLLENFYKKKYNITSLNINIFEAYTEIWAELLNIFFIVKHNKLPYKRFLEYISYEKYFANYQMSKIFYLKSINKKNNDLDKNTNVLPYFIIKCELFNNLIEFLQFCKKSNENFIKIKKLSEIKKFLYNLNTCKSDGRLFANTNKKNYKYLTLRMSLFDYDLFKHLLE